MCSFGIDAISSLDTVTDSTAELDLDQTAPGPFALENEIEQLEKNDLAQSSASVLDQDLQQLGYETEPDVPDVVLSPGEVQDFIDSTTDPDVLRGLKSGIESGLIGIEAEDEPDEDEMQLSLKTL